jgi:hypothetical protein
MVRWLGHAAAGLLVLLVCGHAPGQQPAAPPPSNEIPVVDAARGNCAVEVRVTDTALRPVYAATVSTELHYGFGGFHRLSLEVATNVDGRARFAGLTNKARMPLNFNVLYKGRQTVLVIDLNHTCHAVERAVLPDKRSSNETPE